LAFTVPIFLLSLARVEATNKSRLPSPKVILFLYEYYEPGDKWVDFFRWVFS